jgi:hypothetical protein
MARRSPALKALMKRATSARVCAGEQRVVAALLEPAALGCTAVNMAIIATATSQLRMSQSYDCELGAQTRDGLSAVRRR